MKRNVIQAVVAAVLVGLGSTSFANEAQPELQPTPVELGWFKRPQDATTYLSDAKTGSAMNSYQFLNDASPL